jgi:hypothetical protein
MLTQNGPILKLLNVDIWHKAGYTGKNKTAVILDGPDGLARKGMSDYYTDVFGTSKKAGHGTNAAQTIHEIAPDSKVLYFDNTRNKDAVFAKVEELAKQGKVNIVSISQAGLIGMATPDYLRYQTLRDKYGVIVVCSAGNDGYIDHLSYPAEYDFTIAIGSTDVTGTKTDSFSNKGPRLNAVCPDHVYILNSEDKAWEPSGTSFAGPVAVGLLLCYSDWKGDLNTAEALDLIATSSVDMYTPKRDDKSGMGLFCLPKTIPVAQITPPIVVPEEVIPVSIAYKRTIQATTIHHMGDGLPPEVSILQRWNPGKLDYPEYDYGIEADGTIRIGRPLTVQGAHCISDKPPYNQRGYQWWNRNSIGIGLAGDFTKYPMPDVQFKALVRLVKALHSEYGLSLDQCYPHGQVTYSDCPGCTYSKVPALTKGLWSYDNFEQAVLGITKEEEDTLDVAILKHSSEDEWAAKDVDITLGGVANFTRQGTTSRIPAEALSAKKLFIIGGPDVSHPNRVYLSGNTKYDTAVAVGKYLGGL